MKESQLLNLDIFVTCKYEISHRTTIPHPVPWRLFLQSE